MVTCPFSAIAPLTTEELETLTVGKTLTTRNLVTGQEASVHYGADRTRTIFFDPHRVVRSPYEIKDGKRIEQTALGVEITVTVYKVGRPLHRRSRRPGRLRQL